MVRFVLTLAGIILLVIVIYLFFIMLDWMFDISGFLISIIRDLLHVNVPDYLHDTRSMVVSLIILIAILLIAVLFRNIIAGILTIASYVMWRKIKRG